MSVSIFDSSAETLNNFLFYPAFLFIFQGAAMSGQERLWFHDQVLPLLPTASCLSGFFGWAL